VRLELTSVRIAAQYVASQDDGCPSDQLWDRLKKTIGRYEASPEVQVVFDRDFIDLHVNLYAHCCLSAWTREHDAIVDAVNTVARNIGGMRVRQIDRPAVRRVTDPILRAISETDQYMYAVRCLATDPDVTNLMDKIRESLAGLQHQVEGFPR
jgi:hypothetical protein